MSSTTPTKKLVRLGLDAVSRPHGSADESPVELAVRTGIRAGDTRSTVSVKIKETSRASFKKGSSGASGT